MSLVHQIFDFIGIPVLVVVHAILFFAEKKSELRKRVQSAFKRNVINSLLSFPSFVLLRFLFLPVIVWLAYINQTLHFGLNYLYELPAWLEVTIAFLLLDYTNYLWHLLNHKLPFLWRFHLVHHTDLDLDVTTAFRFHFGEIIGSVIFRGAATFLIGVSPVTVLVYEIIFEAATQFHHTNINLPLSFEKALNKIIVTPRMHGIHHSIVRNETDSNYAVIFSFWDRLHKTLRLNIHQHKIITGVPLYQNPNELTVKNLLALPFKKIRDENDKLVKDETRLASYNVTKLAE